MTDKIVIFSTAESPEQAEALARALVEAKLAACVNIVPAVRSIYRWQGAVHDAIELLLIIKTRQDLFPFVRDTITRLHTYSTPEVIAVPIADGAAPYLEWLQAETNAPPGS